MLFFIERLSFSLLFFYVLPRLFQESRGAGSSAARATRVFVIDGPELALRLAACLGRFNGFSTERFNFRMIDVKDEKGLLLRLRIAYFDLGEVQHDVRQDPLFKEWVRRHPNNPRLEAYLAKSSALMSLNQNDTLWRALYLIQLCAWKARSLGGPKEITLWLSRRAWHEAIERYASRAGVRLLPTPTRRSLRLYFKRLLSARWILALHLLQQQGLKAIWHYLFSYSRASPVMLHDSPAKLAVEYHGQLNLGEPQLQSDLFFWKQSSLPAEDVLVLFGVPRDPLDLNHLAEMQKYGLSALALYPGPAWRKAPFFLPRQRQRLEFPTLSAALPQNRQAELAWLKQCTTDYCRQRSYWVELFSRYQIKAFVTWYKSDGAHCAMADAMESLGGVTAIYQRSYESHPTVELSVHTDVQFCFSHSSAGHSADDGSTVPLSVVTGFLGDHRFPLLREAARELRTRLSRRGVKRVIALFDENSADDSRWHTGHELQRSNYHLLLEKVLCEPWLGLLIKPKVPATLRRRLGPLADVLARAEASQRCIVLERGKIASSDTPVSAALAADIAIHGHLCGGTAGIEAALAGVPTLLMDQEGWAVSPLYRLGVGTVVFNDWNQLWLTLVEHWKRPQGIPGFGDWSAMLPEFDPFRDGKAAHRMGEFLHWTLAALREGLGQEASLTRAAERYAAIWGKTMVIENGVMK